MTIRRSQAAMAIRIVLVGDTIRGLREKHLLGILKVQIHGIETEMFSCFLSFFADKNIFKRIFST